MPVYLFTYHAYRSWAPDRPSGFVQKGHGLQEPSPELADAYAEAAGFPRFLFDSETQRLLLSMTLDVCARRCWRLHGGATEPTHLHVLLSWRGDPRWQEVRGKIRNLLSLGLSRRHGIQGRPWFSQGASRKRVSARKHFDHLMEEYLPKHGGVQWYEDRGWVL